MCMWPYNSVNASSVGEVSLVAAMWRDQISGVIALLVGQSEEMCALVLQNSKSQDVHRIGGRNAIFGRKEKGSAKSTCLKTTLQGQINISI